MEERAKNMSDTPKKKKAAKGENSRSTKTLRTEITLKRTTTKKKRISKTNRVRMSCWDLYKISGENKKELNLSSPMTSYDMTGLSGH